MLYIQVRQTTYSVSEQPESRLIHPRRDGRTVQVRSTNFHDPERLKEDLLEEKFGRCTAPVFADDGRGERVQIGWTFEEDRPWGVRETIVTVHRSEPKVVLRYVDVSDGRGVEVEV